MQPNYPSVAKPCTSSHCLRRSHFSQMENIKRTKQGKITILMDVAEAGLADFGHCRGGLPVSNLALAHEVLPWGKEWGCVRLQERHGERRKWPRLPLAIPVFVRSRDDKGKEFLEFATALNVSAGGMLLAVRRAQLTDAVISLEIPSAPLAALALLPRASRYLRARSLRSSQANGYHLLGLKFSRPLVSPRSS